MCVTIYQNTLNESSFFYLLENDGSYFLAEATRSPFFTRYSISKPMSFSEEVYETSDYYNDITVLRDGNTLKIQEAKNISEIRYLLLFLLFVSVFNFICACKRENI